MATKAIALKKETAAACAKVSVSGKKFFELPIEGRVYTRDTHCSILAHLAAEFFGVKDDDKRKEFMKLLIDESNSTESSNFKKRLVALEMLPPESKAETKMD